jgi:hypothetical protein
MVGVFAGSAVVGSVVMVGSGEGLILGSIVDTAVGSTIIVGSGEITGSGVGAIVA